MKWKNEKQSVFFCLALKAPEYQINREDVSASLNNLRQLIEAKVHILQPLITEEQQVKGILNCNLKLITTFNLNHLKFTTAKNQAVYDNTYVLFFKVMLFKLIKLSQ